MLSQFFATLTIGLSEVSSSFGIGLYNLTEVFFFSVTSFFLTVSVGCTVTPFFTFSSRFEILSDREEVSVTAPFLTLFSNDASLSITADGESSYSGLASLISANSYTIRGDFIHLVSACASDSTDVA